MPPGRPSRARNTKTKIVTVFRMRFSLSRMF
jgi:hypothetical protein